MAKGLSSIVGGYRRARRILTASDAAIPVPSWAQGGQCIVRVTGCGAGGAGGSLSSDSTGRRSAGGGSGGYAYELPIIIPAGVTTLAATVGTGGVGVPGGSGTQGGNTTLLVGDLQLTLRGGMGGGGMVPGPGGAAHFGATLVDLNNFSSGVFGYGTTTAANRGPGGSGALIAGAFGGSVAGNSWGSGAASLFGAPGINLSDPGAGVAAAGADATGYGAGGGGGHAINNVGGPGGNGSPGVLILEFEEWPAA